MDIKAWLKDQMVATEAYDVDVVGRAVGKGGVNR